MAEKREPSAPRLDDPNERLAWARERAGFENATDAARRFHWNENTYRSHENGARGVSKKAAAKYARAFKVPVEWLLYGQGSMTGPLEPEVRTLWDGLTPTQREEVKKFMRFLSQRDAA